ncbi:hypothetical protein [Rhizobium mesoamericanum]|uniref:hypothetical protein n=1 Tax=Rhizobium mesoamericanum TaxID=1079800 RepID=UPI0012F882AA|nr:hypothetical protein [Rhizobium mesoamericanum]
MATLTRYDTCADIGSTRDIGGDGKEVLVRTGMQCDEKDYPPALAENPGLVNTPRRMDQCRFGFDSRKLSRLAWRHEDIISALMATSSLGDRSLGHSRCCLEGTRQAILKVRMTTPLPNSRLTPYGIAASSDA